MAISLSRRGFLMRGTLGTAAVTVGLPFLDCFLDTNGTALAATLGGGALPVRFGTWFWGCGMIPERWTPKAVGEQFDLPPQLAPLTAHRKDISIVSGHGVALDGKSNVPHISGNIGFRTGTPMDNWQQIAGPTFDVPIADAIGSGSLYRSLELAADGDPRTTYSYRSATVVNASVPTALDLYHKVFGADFHDPNAAGFTPDPAVMVRRSVLSGITEQRRRLQGMLGAADKARVDQYFTAIREVEGKLALQLQKPPPAAACRVPDKPRELQPNADVAQRRENHRAMAELLAMALACNQTRVFNMAFSIASSDLRQAGEPTAYHQATHEEMIDRTLGYQPAVDRFATLSMEALAEFIAAMAAVPEGDGRLLDNMLIVAHSDVSFAKLHVLTGIPCVFAGKAGGRIRTGLHITGTDQPASRIALTAQQAMGLSVDTWGTDSMRTNRPITELIAS
jgi:hypothetical protein